MSGKKIASENGFYKNFSGLFFVGALKLRSGAQILVFAATIFL